MGEIQSDAFVLFGATGDLAFKKIFPALHSMIKRGAVTGTILGVSRGGSSFEKLRERAHESIKEYGGGGGDAAFKKLCSKLRHRGGGYRTPELFPENCETPGGAKHPPVFFSLSPRGRKRHP